MNKRICMLVMNEVVRDGRVIRSARLLNNYATVSVVGLSRGSIEVNSDQVAQELGIKVSLARLKRNDKQSKNIYDLLTRYHNAATQMINLALSEQPDIIHAHDSFTLHIARKVQKKTGARLVYDAHELYRESSFRLKGIIGAFRNRVENWGLRNADLIIACNPYRAKIMYEEYGARILPSVVINTVPVQLVKQNAYLKEQFAKAHSLVSKIVIYQGAINSARCIEELIYAVSNIPDPSIGLVIIGVASNTYNEFIKRKIQKLRLEKRVLILPPVFQSQLYPIISGADAGIVLYRPDNRNNYYCASNKLMEYAMSGLPIIGADLPPIKEFIQKYDCGVTVDPLSSDQIADAIFNLFEYSDNFENYKTNLQIAARSESWEVHSKALSTAYQQSGLL